MIPHHCVPLILETELIHVKYPYVVEGVVQIDHLVPYSLLLLLLVGWLEGRVVLVVVGQAGVEDGSGGPLPVPVSVG